MLYIRAETYAKDSSAVMYVSDDGQKIVRWGGSRSWRNNNPGNIRYTDFSRRHGAIGSAGGFAVFADYRTGRAAISFLLQSGKYVNSSIAKAISTYAPPQENDTQQYKTLLARITGLDTDRRISDLTANELDHVVDAIQQIEGFIVGIEKPVKKVIGALTDGSRLTAFLIAGDSSYIPVSAAIALADRGEIDAVVVHPSQGKAYLRAHADRIFGNNFSAIAHEPA
jgi:hypothetical protein